VVLSFWLPLLFVSAAYIAGAAATTVIAAAATVIAAAATVTSVVHVCSLYRCLCLYRCCRVLLSAAAAIGAVNSKAQLMQEVE
jgi:hypothetical protein